MYVGFRVGQEIATMREWVANVNYQYVVRPSQHKKRPRTNGGFGLASFPTTASFKAAVNHAMSTRAARCILESFDERALASVIEQREQ